MHRPKSHLPKEKIQIIINSIKEHGIEVFPTPTGEILIYMDDLIFYKVAMEKHDSGVYLVTGNQNTIQSEIL